MELFESIAVNYPTLSFVKKEDVNTMLDSFEGIYSEEDIEPVLLVAHFLLSKEDGLGPGCLNAHQIDLLNFILFLEENSKSSTSHMKVEVAKIPSEFTTMREEQDREFEKALKIDSNNDVCIDNNDDDESNVVKEENSSLRKELTIDEIRKAREAYFFSKT